MTTDLKSQNLRDFEPFTLNTELTSVRMFFQQSNADENDDQAKVLENIQAILSEFTLDSLQRSQYGSIEQAQREAMMIRNDLNMNTYLSIDNKTINIPVRFSGLNLNSYQVQPGSIIANLSVCGAFLIGGYHAIANYSSFKSGLTEIREDIIKSLSKASERMGYRAHSPQHYLSRKMPPPIKKPITTVTHVIEANQLEKKIQDSIRNKMHRSK
ncbi:MAG: hypothetical protein HWE33_04470 [Rhodobacteraceae bacterium]|nr:hypothetical protein [Paracoccaceae bacterium]